jgi:copper chaperone CopZ
MNKIRTCGASKSLIKLDNMKTKVLAMMLAFSFSSPVFAEAKVMSAKITGMHCGSCAEKITAELKKLPEVADASVNFKTKKATVTLKEGAELSTAKIEQTIADAGYQASQVR